MFEKSLYDLIRGLRSNKGQEREYIDRSLQECRKEIKGQDMELKAIALLKLTYLEMLGHDMSWASFHVLEVMSSPKMFQKRVGYLAAIQSFRPNTDVLMLAENQLQKDLVSGSTITTALTLSAIPHMLTPTIAASLVGSVVPFLSGASPALCKKAIVAIYRMALVYPDALRPAWPKIKDRLLTEDEDPSITAAIVNVVCELGWRRPHDFLPLSPRLFDILVNGRNNWMAIKIIKLFATLVTIERRLVKKLLPALTTVISTTPAMSLVYECINGIVGGGLLESIHGTPEGDEVVKMCLTKLANMLETDRDRNLKYVGLMAFQRIAIGSPDLVNEYADVILPCLDDEDVSIRMSTLELCRCLSDVEIVPVVVSRLLGQLVGADENQAEWHPIPRVTMRGLTKYLADVPVPADAPAGSPDYNATVVRTILDLCSRDNYKNIDDFEWLLHVMAYLIRLCPPAESEEGSSGGLSSPTDSDVSFAIGHRLQDIAIRVSNMRPEVVAIAESLVLITSRSRFLPSRGKAGKGVLNGAGFLVGEFAEMLVDPLGVLLSLTNAATVQLHPRTIATFVQAIPKVLCIVCSRGPVEWSSTQQRAIRTAINKSVVFLDSIRTHPILEVQERAGEYLELLTVVDSAVASHPAESESKPALLSHVLPSLFSGQSLNPIAPGALARVPIPAEVASISENSNLSIPTASTGTAYNSPSLTESSTLANFRDFYLTRPASARNAQTPAINLLDSYRDSTSSLDDRSGYRRNEQRRLRNFHRNRADPFYLASYANDEDDSHNSSSGGTDSRTRSRNRNNRSKSGNVDRARHQGSSTPIHNIIASGNTQGDFDIDAIPALDLVTGGTGPQTGRSRTSNAGRQHRSRGSKRPQTVLLDETLDLEDPASPMGLTREQRRDGGRMTGDAVSTVPTGSTPSGTTNLASGSTPTGPRRNVLQVDSSGLDSLDLLDSRPIVQGGDNDYQAPLSSTSRQSTLQQPSSSIHPTSGSPFFISSISRPNRLSRLGDDGGIKSQPFLPAETEEERIALEEVQRARRLMHWEASKSTGSPIASTSGTSQPIPTGSGNKTIQQGSDDPQCVEEVVVRVHKRQVLKKKKKGKQVDLTTTVDSRLMNETHEESRREPDVGTDNDGQPIQSGVFDRIPGSEKDEIEAQGQSSHPVQTPVVKSSRRRKDRERKSKSDKTDKKTRSKGKSQDQVEGVV